MENDSLAGNTGTYPLSSSKASARSKQEPGFMTGLIATINGAMLALTPETEPGQLTITKFTKQEIVGTYSFTDKGSTVTGKFEFKPINDEG